MILAFQDSATLGVCETICATGMLVSSVLIGSITIKKGYTLVLSASLFCAGIFMAVFGLSENMLLICISGFLFFSMLPFANSSIDYLIRSNIKNELQGRAWGVIGIISQLGYVVAYAFSGMLADNFGKKLGIGVGRGAGILIIISGGLLSVTAVILYTIKSVKNLENGGKQCTIESLKTTS